jgi:transposase
LQAELTALVGAVAPWLLEVPGVGPLSAAQVLASWSHTGRFRSEAAFAALAGTNPIPASSVKAANRMTLGLTGRAALLPRLQRLVLPIGQVEGTPRLMPGLIHRFRRYLANRNRIR